MARKYLLRLGNIEQDLTREGVASQIEVRQRVEVLRQSLEEAQKDRAQQ